MQQLKVDHEAGSGTHQGKPTVNSNLELDKQWVKDSGAIEHNTCDASLLKEISMSWQQSVHIPNGTSVPVNGFGKISLSNGMQLYKVLHIPDFKCNLISVSKLTRKHNCAVTFIVDSCVKQDLHSRTLIGKGRHQVYLRLY